MNTLRFEVAFEDLPGFRADAVLGKTVFEVVQEPGDLRPIRSTVMDIARYGAGNPKRRGVLLLNEPKISDSRILGEWEKIMAIIRPEVLNRLAMVTHRAGAPDQVIGELSAEERGSLETIFKEAHKHSSRAHPRPSETFFDILRILINQWIKRAAPQTSRSLAEAAGCTYPTIAAALEKMENYLIRHSDRRVELKAFPKDEWFRLVANADKVRQTLRFADPSGQPRSIESLLARLQKLHLKGVAIAGVPGARRLFPAIDLIGTPRLDLTIHCRTRQPDLSFLRQLDPALKPAGHGEPARLVIHVLRQAQVYFETTPDGTLWADPVECLLDLHEMRLESQAQEMIRHLVLESI